MSRAITILGVVSAVLLVAASDLAAINPRYALYAMLLANAASAAGRSLMPKRNQRAPGQARNIAPVLLPPLLLFVGMGMQCSGGQLRTAAGAFEQGAREGQREVAALARAGDLTAEEAARLAPIFAEMEASARNFSAELAGINELTPTARRRIITLAITEVSALVENLEAREVIRLRSERARNRFANITRGVRLGLAALRVYEASLPSEESPL